MSGLAPGSACGVLFALLQASSVGVYWQRAIVIEVEKSFAACASPVCASAADAIISGTISMDART